jgi:hypothetical protein
MSKQKNETSCDESAAKAGARKAVAGDITGYVVKSMKDEETKDK